MIRGLLPGIRVLELDQGISGPYCGKLFAQMGAEVIKVEPIEGDYSRGMGPFPNDIPHPEKSGLYLALNCNKFGVTIDLSTTSGIQQLMDIIPTVDIMIANFLPDSMIGLDPDSIRDCNPEIILTSITPFGNWGPYAEYKSSDLILYHMSSHAHGLLGPVDQPNSDPPIRAGGHQSDFVAGMAAATASMMALYRKLVTKHGCHIEISSYESMVTQLISGLANCSYGKPAPPRSLSALQEAATGGMVAAIGGILPCNDGYVAISPREQTQWERWVDILGNPQWSDEKRFKTREDREANSPELWELMSNWSRNHSKNDIANWGQQKRIPCFPVNTVLDLFNNTHLKEREFFMELNHPIAGVYNYPGAPYSLSNCPLPLDARPAPVLGEHNQLLLKPAN